MLIDFAVTNFRSIRDRQSLNLSRSPRTARASQGEWIRPDLAPVLAIYGANAAGKSSLIEAFRYVTDAVDDSYARWDTDGGVPRSPFLLDRESRLAPTEFDIEFVAEDGIEYRYGFSIDNTRVLTEFLHQYKTRRKTIIFERDLDSYKFGDSFRGPAALLRETTRPNSLFLSAAAAARLEATRHAHNWLSNKLSVYAAPGYMAEHTTIKRLIQSDDVYRASISKFILGADLGVAAIDVVKQELEPASRESLRKAFEARPDSSMKFEDLVRSIETEIQLSHVGIDDQYDLPFDSESDGTHALLSFASVAIRSLAIGAVCIVDEIDSSLHPMIVSELISLFADPRSNPNQAQLIFTSHDVSLLRPGTALESDAVWLVEKNKTGESSLISIREFGLPRKDENVERGYLTGRYGGLPFTSLVNNMIEARKTSA
ncbi:ATP-binding protein [Clavibacter michiganensis subsp. michiganensis]|uniref:AAA family ATPase n=1 Tax=Clavibacter michiganensis TaxID=28447 RepID=UPI001C64E21F|nr:ATP-binding protein [Clavibacter michiganensis]MBW8026101.1 ATP-binding protein [Clavibacter michiganensis subsp. michiganensis]